METITREKVLLIGGSGVVGASLYDDLKTKILVQRTFYTRYLEGGVRYVAGISNLDDLYESSDRPKIFLYCGGSGTTVNQCNNNPTKSINDLLADIIRLVEFCKRKEIKLIFISSDAVYGECIEGPRGEDAPCAPKSPYAAIRYLAERVIIERLKRYMIVRMGPFLTDAKYGAGFVYNLVSRKGDDFILYPNDNQCTPTVKTDLSAFIKKAIADDVTGIFNIGSSTGISSLNLARLFVECNEDIECNLVGVAFESLYDPRYHVKFSSLVLTRYLSVAGKCQCPLKEKISNISTALDFAKQ